MKYLKLEENQKQGIEFKNAHNSITRIPIMLIDDSYYVAYELLGAKMYENFQAILEDCEVVEIDNENADDDVV